MGNRIAISLLVLLVACTESEPQFPNGYIPDVESSSCGERASHGPLAACIGYDMGDSPLNHQLPLLTRATVTQRGDVSESVACFTDQGSLGNGDAAVSSKDARWLQVQLSNGSPTIIGVAAEAFEWPSELQVGSEVSLSYEFVGGGFSPSQGKLEIRSIENDDLLVWVGAAGTVDDIPTPLELTLSQGPEVCRNHSRCIPDWAQYDLWIQLDGEQRTTALGYGKHVAAGDFVVAHGGVDQQIGGATMCPDAFIAYAAAAAWRAN